MGDQTSGLGHGALLTSRPDGSEIKSSNVTSFRQRSISIESRLAKSNRCALIGKLVWLRVIAKLLIYKYFWLRGGGF